MGSKLVPRGLAFHPAGNKSTPCQFILLWHTYDIAQLLPEFMIQCRTVSHHSGREGLGGKSLGKWGRGGRALEVGGERVGVGLQGTEMQILSGISYNNLHKQELKTYLY